MTDTPELIDKLVSKAKKIGIDFIIFGGMTMKLGRQQDHFLKILKKNYPQLLSEYATIYRGDKWGSAIPEYRTAISHLFDSVAARHKIAKRIPARLFNDILSENDLVVVILEQIDYLLKLKGAKSPYGYAAYSISKLEEPISALESVTQLKGVGKATASIIREILRTGTSSYYEQLLGVRS